MLPVFILMGLHTLFTFSSQTMYGLSVALSTHFGDSCLLHPLPLEHLMEGHLYHQHTEGLVPTCLAFFRVTYISEQSPWALLEHLWTLQCLSSCCFWNSHYWHWCIIHDYCALCPKKHHHWPACDVFSQRSLCPRVNTSKSFWPFLIGLLRLPWSQPARPNRTVTRLKCSSNPTSDVQHDSSKGMCRQGKQITFFPLRSVMTSKKYLSGC